jgi:zinc transport system permease protein
LFGFLFGDILALTGGDLISIYGWGFVVIGTLFYIWPQILAWVVDEELALVEGVNVKRVRLIFMVLFALVIAVAIKIVGVLLITALMIIPAATARRFARTPSMMAIFSAIVGCVAVLLGLGLSFVLDIPAGPAIVLCAAFLFGGSLVFAR